MPDARVTAFTVLELLMGNQQGRGGRGEGEGGEGGEGGRGGRGKITDKSITEQEAIYV